MKSEAKKLNRGQFMRELGLSSGALMAFYCLESCSKPAEVAPKPVVITPPAIPAPTPTPVNTGITGNTETGKGKIDFVLDLAVAPNDKLKIENEFAVIGDVFIAFTKSKNYIALSKFCTHENQPLKYRSATDDIKCDTHGSEFKTSGAVQAGPATRALIKYVVTLDGSKLTVKE